LNSELNELQEKLTNFKVKWWILILFHFPLWS
jgi:hypothetical protein